jgi:hypothetical protein
LRALALSVEYALLPSVRCPEFSGKPTGSVRFQGIRCSDAYLDVIALGAFEQPVFEADGARRHAFQHHPGLAAGTAKALDGDQELLGRGHGASPVLRRERYRTLCHRWVPLVGGDMAVLAHREAPLLVNIAHISKVNDLGRCCARRSSARPVRASASRTRDLPMCLPSSRAPRGSAVASALKQRDRKGQGHQQCGGRRINHREKRVGLVHDLLYARVF